MTKINKTMSVGGAERAKVEGADAAQTGGAAVVVGPAATQVVTLTADRIADELVDAAKAATTADKAADEKVDGDQTRRTDEGHDLTKEEKETAAKAWNDDLDEVLVRREVDVATVAPGPGDAIRVAAVQAATERDAEGVAATRSTAATEDLRKGDERVAADRTSADLDTSRGKQAGQGQDHAAAEVEAQAASREQWLQALRDEHQALAEVGDAGLERILALAANLDNVRGQIVEELLNVELEERARAMGPEYEVFRGGSIKSLPPGDATAEVTTAEAWRRGENLTDGMIVRQARGEAGVYDVAAIAEAKAGELSARGLGEKNVAFERLGQEQRRVLEDWAVDVLRERAGATDNDRQPGGWAHGDELRATHRREIEALMEELHGPDQTGQLRNDIERLMGHASKEDVAENVRAREAVTVLVERDQIRDEQQIREISLRASPAQTLVLAATPSDVDIEQTRARLGEQGIRVEAVDVGLTAAEVGDVARGLQQALADRERAERAAADAGRQRDADQGHGGGLAEQHDAPAQQTAQGAQQVLDQALEQARERDRQRLDELRNLEDALRDLDDD